MALLLHHGCVHWVSHDRREDSVSAATTAASARREYSYGRLPAETEAVLWFFFQLPHLHLVYHGFKEQSTQYE